MASESRTPSDNRISECIRLTQEYMLRIQKPDGHWVGELEGDTILESEYFLLLYFLGRGNDPKCDKLVEYLKKKMLPEGGWAIYPGGPPEVSAP